MRDIREIQGAQEAPFGRQRLDEPRRTRDAVEADLGGGERSVQWAGNPNSDPDPNPDPISLVLTLSLPRPLLLTCAVGWRAAGRRRARLRTGARAAAR